MFQHAIGREMVIRSTLILFISYLLVLTQISQVITFFLETLKVTGPIYIGQGDLNDRAKYHHQAQCIKQKGATHFHCHSNSNEHGRLDEESDMLDNYPQAYHQPDVMN